MPFRIKYLKCISLVITFFLLTTTTLFFVVGCATTKEEKKALPAASKSAKKTPITHSLSGVHSGFGERTSPFGLAPPKGKTTAHLENVSTTIYKKAVIRVLDKSNEQSKLIEVEIGGKKVPLLLDESGIMIKATRFFSDFALNQFGPTSRSDELRNPALQVIITRDKEELFNGYLFSKFPDQHSFQHDVIKLVLVDILK